MLSLPLVTKAALLGHSRGPAGIYRKMHLLLLLVFYAAFLCSVATSATTGCHWVAAIWTGVGGDKLVLSGMLQSHGYAWTTHRTAVLIGEFVGKRVLCGKQSEALSPMETDG